MKPSVNENIVYRKAIQEEWFNAYSFTRDKRDIRAYPLNGHYFQLGIKNITYLGDHSDINLFLRLTLSKFFALDSNWYASAGITTRVYQGGRLPYTNATALGYKKDYIRGYELNVMDGPEFHLFKSQVRRRVLERRIQLHQAFRQYETVQVALFLGPHFDAGFVPVLPSIYPEYASNTLTGGWQYGYGLGLDIVVFYDYVARIEFSRNKQGQHNVYLHFVSAF
jgi:hypothetical protein